MNPEIKQIKNGCIGLIDQCLNDVNERQFDIVRYADFTWNPKTKKYSLRAKENLLELKRLSTLKKELIVLRKAVNKAFKNRMK